MQTVVSALHKHVFPRVRAKVCTTANRMYTRCLQESSSSRRRRRDVEVFKQSVATYVATLRGGVLKRFGDFKSAMDAVGQGLSAAGVEEFNIALKAFVGVVNNLDRAINPIYSMSSVFGKLNSVLKHTSCPRGLRWACSLADKLTDAFFDVLHRFGIPDITGYIREQLEKIINKLPGLDFNINPLSSFDPTAPLEAWIDKFEDILDVSFWSSLDNSLLDPTNLFFSNLEDGVALTTSYGRAPAQFSCPNSHYPFVHSMTYTFRECSEELGHLFRIPCSTTASGCSRDISQVSICITSESDPVLPGVKLGSLTSLYDCVPFGQEIPLLPEILDLEVRACA